MRHLGSQPITPEHLADGTCIAPLFLGREVAGRDLQCADVYRIRRHFKIPKRLHAFQLRWSAATLGGIFMKIAALLDNLYVAVKGSCSCATTVYDLVGGMPT